MPTQIEVSQQATDDRGLPRVRDAADTTTEQPSGADPTIQRVQDLMVQLARQGVDISLRSLQVWADLTRHVGLTALGSFATATYDLFEKLLAAQREVIDELVATQRQFAQGLLDTTPTVGDGLSLTVGPTGAHQSPILAHGETGRVVGEFSEPCRGDHEPQ